jgi:hypothetical protein
VRHMTRLLRSDCSGPGIAYIDPRVFDAYRAGLVIGRPLREAADTEPGELPIHQRALEEAVLDLIDERDRSAALERVAARPPSRTRTAARATRG